MFHGMRILKTPSSPLVLAWKAPERCILSERQRVREIPAVATEGDRQGIARLLAGVIDQVVPTVGKPAGKVLAGRVGAIRADGRRPRSPLVATDRLIQIFGAASVTEDKMAGALGVDVPTRLTHPIVWSVARQLCYSPMKAGKIVRDGRVHDLVAVSARHK